MRCYLCDVCDDGKSGLVWTIHLGMHICAKCNSTHVVAKPEEKTEAPAKAETKSQMNEAKKARFNRNHVVTVPGYIMYAMSVGQWVHEDRCCWCSTKREEEQINSSVCQACDTRQVNQEQKTVVRKWFRDQGLTT